MQKNFLIKRIIHALTVLTGISFLSFVLANISPVDPAEAYARRMSKAASAEVIEQYRETFGFNDPVPLQYVKWLRGILTLDFGTSYISGRPAMHDLLSVLPVTLILAGLTGLIIVFVSVPLGIIAALYEGRWPDRLIMGTSFVSISIPGYFLGILCLYFFALQLKIMPVVGHGHPVSLFFAALILALPMAGSLIRILRSLLLENQSAEYVRYAKARGISRRGIMVNHLLRNAAPPCITMFGQNIGYLIAGTAVAETIFSIPGLGQFALTAALNRDFPVINSYILLTAVCFVTCNILAETCGMLLNPAMQKEEY